MLKKNYHRYPYFFNLVVVLVLIETTRTLDWLAWYPPAPQTIMIFVFEQLIEFLSMLPFVLLLIISYKWALQARGWYLVVVLALLFTLLGPALIIYFSSGLESVLFPQESRPPVTVEVLKKYSPGLMAAILFLNATFYLTRLQLKFAKQTTEMQKAGNLAREVQLKMLQYQINPHFLFNVLNSIHALIDENTGKAKKLVVEMSDYYRSTLTNQDQTISIDKEIQSVMKYLEIQKTRFEEEFEFEVSVDEAVRTVLIPSFILHLLIENAVKYGMEHNKKQLMIRLSVTLLDKVLRIRVSNTGKLAVAKVFNPKNPDETSNSIEIIKNRLALLYEENSSFRLIEENGWVHATLELTLPTELKANPGPKLKEPNFCNPFLSTVI